MFSSQNIGTVMRQFMNLMCLMILEKILFVVVQGRWLWSGLSSETEIVKGGKIVLKAFFVCELNCLCL